MAAVGFFLLAFSQYKGGSTAKFSLVARALGLRLAVYDSFAGVEPMGFYEYPRFAALLTAVEKRFRDMEPVLEELGVQMMTDWYEHGPGKQVVTSGVGFLKFQTGSEGYRSVVAGPPAAIGEFVLESLDETAGAARIRSTTPFPKTMERGILIGGMRAPGDLTYVDVDNSADPFVFDVAFR